MNIAQEHGTPTLADIKCQSVPTIDFSTSDSNTIYFRIKPLFYTLCYCFEQNKLLKP